MPLIVILTHAGRETVHNNGIGPLPKKMGYPCYKPSDSQLFLILRTTGRNFLSGEVS